VRTRQGHGRSQTFGSESEPEPEVLRLQILPFSYAHTSRIKH